MQVKIKEFTTFRLIKSEDLNHHGTLFAGRASEWFVESGFIAATHFVNPKHLICLKIHGLTFLQPAKGGQTLCITSKAILSGKTSITVYIKIELGTSGVYLVDGFATFVHINEETKAVPHNIEIMAETEEDKKLQQMAEDSKKNITSVKVQ